MSAPPPDSPSEAAPSPGAPDDAPLKLTGAQVSLRGPRRQPARFSAKMLMAIGTVSALAITAALFVPSLLAKKPIRIADASQAQTHSPPAVPPGEAMTYGSPDAAAAPGATPPIDCGQTPGAVGCAPPGTAPAGRAASGALSAAEEATAQPGQTAGSGAQAGASPGGQAAGRSGILGSLQAADGGARTSGVFFGGPFAQPVQAVETAASKTPEAAASLLPPWPAAPVQAAKPAPTPTDVMAQNGQGEKGAFLKEDSVSPDYVAAKLQRPRSPYEIKAGSVIPAALLTAVNSDLPGEIIAQVTQPVFDHVTGRYVLIPQGARVIGRYDSQVAYGQSRALIVWHRLIFPNGDSINFGSMGASDPTGASGVADRVNDHFGQLFKGIVLSTLLSVGATSAQDAQARSSGTLVVNSAESGVAQEAQTVGQRLTERDLNRQPTIEIRQGVQVRVLVDKDMILAPYN